MGWIAQKTTRLDGVDYEPGDVVPDEVGSERLVRLGLLSAVPDAGVAGIRAGAPAATAAFDPEDHTVDEVLEYVAGNPEQTERVVEAETSGKARKTLLEALAEPTQSEEPIENGEGSPEDEGEG